MEQHHAMVIALGQPSDPVPHVATLRQIATRVMGLLPGWTVRGAVMESPGSVKAAACGLERPLVYPLFMTSGYFLNAVLPRRLSTVVPEARVLPPLGADPAMPHLVADIALAAARANAFAAEETSLLLAAHGSATHPGSRASTERLAAGVARLGRFRRVVTGFIEEPPFIADAARNLGQAVCLPVFALRASHVTADVPEALRMAEFEGPLLPPLGMSAQVPGLIAAALRAAARGERAGPQPAELQATAPSPGDGPWRSLLPTP
jgi:sirohydrochlorin ferrochelatase